jgi:hypothetical protein
MTKLTKEQMDKMVKAIDDGTLITDDPIVNFYIDRDTGVEDEFYDWALLPSAIKTLYIDEAKLFKKSA